MPVRTPVLESRVLTGNPMGDPVARSLLICVPPDYEETDRRYPVVYFLPGFASRGSMLLNESLWEETLPQRLERLIRTGAVTPMILVAPDCTTRLGGSQYINSAGTGRYADYIADEIVAWVDANYRTTACRDERAVMGKSSGGYGALRLAMDRPEVFGLAADHSGDKGFDLCYRVDFPKCVAGLAPYESSAENFLRGFPHPRHERGPFWFDVVNVLAMASCYSPRADVPWGFDLPFDELTCELRSEVWERWLAHDPLRLVDGRQEALRSLRLLYLDCGRRDEHHLHLGARTFSRHLRALGIAHTYEEFDGSHFNTSHRYDVSLQAISRVLEANRSGRPLAS
jgi:enterochelin esterase family protein